MAALMAKLFVGLTGGDGVEVFDLTGAEPRSVGQIKTAAGAHAFRAAGDDRHLFVSNRVANTISKIDMVTSQVVANYPAPGGPDCMDRRRLTAVHLCGLALGAQALCDRHGREEGG